MLKYLHLTKLQWRGVLRWSLYALWFLILLLVQDIVLSQRTLFGAKLIIIPLPLVCVCVREGPEKGGLFALLTALFWCLSGADYGYVSVAVLPIGAILSAILLQAVLKPGILTTALCCLAVSLVNELVIFAFKLIFSRLALSLLWRVLLPGPLLSLLGLVIVYPVVRAIHRLAPGAAADPAGTERRYRSNDL